MKYTLLFFYMMMQSVSHSQIVPIVDSIKGYQYIDTITHKIISKYYYDQANTFKDGMARVSRKGLWGFIDQSGEEVIPCKYLNAVEFNEGVAAVSIGKIEIDDLFSPRIKDENFALIDKKGNIKSDFKFSEVQYSQNGYIAAKDLATSKWGWVDPDGFWIIDPKFEQINSFDEYGMSIVAVSFDNSYTH